MTRWSALAHRRLDEAQAEAETGDVSERVDRPGVLMPPRDRRKDMRTMGRSREPHVLLMRLSQRTSGRGTACLTGRLGKTRLVAFQGEPDEKGNVVWNVYAAEPELREGRR